MSVAARPYVLALALLCAVALLWRDAYERGRHDAGRAVRAATIRTITDTVRVRDIQYQRDTIRLTRWRDRWDSVRVTDTVTVAQVVYVPRTVADSVVSACYAVLRSCEARVAARDTLISTLRGALKAEQASRPSVVRVALDRALWAAVGVGIGAVLISR